MSRYDVRPDRFVMVGNSLRSDILPVIEAGGHAIHVPYEMSWAHEQVPPEKLAGAHYHEIPHIRDLPHLLDELRSKEWGDGGGEYAVRNEQH
jgi:putative hydrolase of the HAD superfamily